MLGLRQVLAIACALAVVALTPLPATAQLAVVPASTPAPPSADSPALGGDAAHRNAWAGTGLRPPLELAWQTDASPVHAAIAVGPRVIVQTATAVRAVRVEDGTELWSVPLARPAEVASEGGRVYLASDAGVAALDAGTGALAWSAAEPGATGPVVAGGRLLTGNGGGELVARQAATGAVLWRAEVGIAGARPAVAGARAYASGVCRGVSVEVGLGLVQWAAGCSQDIGTRTVLASTAVISEDGPIFAAADGRIVVPASGPGTVGAGLVFVNPLWRAQTVLQARDAGTFGIRWTWDPLLPGSMLLRPAVVDEHVWQVEDAGPAGLVLAALDPLTGTERWSGFLPGGGSFAPGVGSAVAAAPGLLLVPTAGGGLAALRNADPGPLSVRATLPRNVVTAGGDTVVTGRLISDGHGLIGPRAVTLQADPHPFEGRYGVVSGAIAGRDAFELAAEVRRNTRFRLAADGIAYPPTPVYAQPSIAVRYKATKVDLVVRATLRIKREPGFRRAGRVGLYRLKADALVAERIGRGRSRRNGVARFRVRIPPDLSESDRVLPCLLRGSKRGFGAPNVLDRECGARRIDIPAQASTSAAAGLSLSTGTGSAMPLKRFIPASENE